MVWAPDYVSADDLQDFLRIDDDDDDQWLTVWATATSRAIDNFCHRQFGQYPAPVARTYRRPPAFDYASSRWLLAVDDFQDLTGALVSGVALGASDAVAWPDNAVADGWAYTHLSYGSEPVTPVVATVRWGWASVPEQVVGAVWLQAARFNKRRDSPFGIAGSPSDNSEMRLSAKLDPDVKVLLRGLVRARIAG